MRKKNLLLITAIPPFPQNSGGATRIKNTIKELSKYFNLNLISFNNQNEIINSSEKKELEKWCQKIIFIAPEPKAIGSYIDLQQPYWFSDCYSAELIVTINNFLKENKIDIVQIEFSQLLYIIDFIKKEPSQKIIFTAHDISTISFYRRLRETKGIKRKLSHFLRLIEIYLYEKKYLPKYGTIISVSQNDKQILKKYLSNKNIICLENGIEKINFLPQKDKTSLIKLGYIGSFEHSPNLNAVKYFFEEIAPLLDEEKIKYEFYLAGKNDYDFIKKTFPKIINLGQVEKTLDFYQKIDCLITPISSGSGSRIKILEALGFGIPIISSSIGAEGININTKLISIANKAQDYVDEIKKIKKPEYKIEYKQEKEKISKLTWEHLFNSINSNS